MTPANHSNQSQHMSNGLLVITGPTASGKTRRAVQCAKSFDGEIISADSRQIYRGMDLGTGKDLIEYQGVPYHMIDICDAGYKYTLYEYLRDAASARAAIESRGKQPILCGGTGLYVESMLNGLRLPEVPANEELRQALSGKTLPELTEKLGQMKSLHNTTDVDTPKRAIRAIEIQTYYQEHPEEAQTTMPNPERNAVIIGVEIDRETRRKRISHRLKERMAQGMAEEVENLLAKGVDAEGLIYYGLEYKFITQYVIGQLSREEALKGLETAIHQFAKRQMTWFRGMERRGWHINWLAWDMPDEEFVQAVSTLMHEQSGT